MISCRKSILGISWQSIFIIPQFTLHSASSIINPEINVSWVLFNTLNHAHLFHFDSGVVARNGIDLTIISFISTIWSVVPIFETGEFKAVLNFLPIKIAEKIPSLKLLVN